MRKPPCADCQMKGCGDHHDKCPEYLAWRSEQRESKQDIGIQRGSKPRMERSKSFRASKNCSVLKSHRR